MPSSDAQDPLGDAIPPPRVRQYLQAKLHPPPRRESWVARTRLVDSLDRASRRPVTLVAAPAGYGKTTLVAQWLDGPGRPLTAWVSLDRGDNDPDRLWTHVAEALEQAGCVLPVSEPSRSVDGSPAETSGAVLPAILNALAAVPDHIVLVLDDFHFIQTPQCHEQVELLVDHLPAQAHLVVISRSDPGLRLGRLRASGDLAEIRASDLAFTVDEAVELLAQVDVRLSDDTVAQLDAAHRGMAGGRLPGRSVARRARGSPTSSCVSSAGGAVSSATT